jgi:hypothetical protein
MCSLSHWDLPNHSAPDVLLVPLESPWWVWVHQDGSALFKPMVQELLNIEQFCQRKLNKIKTKYFREIGASSWYYWKSLYKWDSQWQKIQFHKPSLFHLQIVIGLLVLVKGKRLCISRGCWDTISARTWNQCVANNWRPPYI